MAVVAAIQMVSGPEVAASLAQAGRLMAEAVAAGAGLIVLPENFALMGRSESDKLDVAEEPGHGPIQDFISAKARGLGVWIVGGTVPLKTATPDKVRAACLVYDDAGQQVARYDKVHLFDVAVAGERYTESETIAPGDAVVVVDTPVARVGLAVCYDLRFPELFRAMAARGAELIALPAAFTAATGEAHWEILVRARAIENLCYVVAAAQGGYHASGRETYGHSLIVDPWGTVLAGASGGAGVITAPIHRAHLQDTRERFPALDHIRFNITGP